MHHRSYKRREGATHRKGQEVVVGDLGRLGFLSSSRIIAAGRISCQIRATARDRQIWMVEISRLSAIMRRVVYD
jgi:hypothetical protein